MNRKLLALAIGAAVSLPVAANAAPTLYGLVNVSVDRIVDLGYVGSPNAPAGDRGSDYEVTSNSSRIGVMGDEALGNGLSAVYKAEWAVDGSMAGTTDLAGRDRYVGLKSDWGTLKLGAYDSPLKSSQGMVDQFNDMTYTDMTNVIAGENRLNKIIGYESPVLADAVTVKLALQPGESRVVNGKPKTGLADGMSAAVAYDTTDVHLALAYDHDISSTGSYGMASSSPTRPNDSGRNTIRLTGTYTVGALQLGALIQSSKVAHVDDTATLITDTNAKDDQTAALLSAAYSLNDQDVVKAEVIRAENKLDSTNFNPDKFTTTFYGIGYDHNFTKMTKVYAQAGKADTSNDGGKGDVMSVGMLMKF